MRAAFSFVLTFAAVITLTTDSPSALPSDPGEARRSCSLPSAEPGSGWGTAGVHPVVTCPSDNCKWSLKTCPPLGTNIVLGFWKNSSWSRTLKTWEQTFIKPSRNGDVFSPCVPICDEIKTLECEDAIWRVGFMVIEEETCLSIDCHRYSSSFYCYQRDRNRMNRQLNNKAKFCSCLKPIK